MRSLFDESAPEPEESKPNADLTLGMGSLLSIFFGIAIVCGIFFGFGYLMGRRLTHPVTAPVAVQSPAPAKPENEATGSPSKPGEAPGSGSLPTIFKPPAQDEDKPPATAERAAADEGVADQASAAPAGEHAPRKGSAKDAVEEAVPRTEPAQSAKAGEPDGAHPTLAAVPFTHRAPLPAKPHAGVMGPPASPPSPATASAADTTAGPDHPVMVQIAAVSRQEDAEVLAGALRKRGFSPQVHGGTADKFFHVQVGPFPDKAAAETMKQHLLADGYNAIVK